MTSAPLAPPSPPAPGAGPCAWRPGERATVVVLLVAALGLRLHWIFAQEFDTDEAQHLHVAWAWTQGRIPYRDVFDNHTPLFHLLFAPFTSLVGERGDFPVLARLAMLPVFFASLAATHALGRRLFDARIAAWGAVLFAAEGLAFNHAVEVRPDALWTLVWSTALLVLLGGAFTARRAFAGGLLVGLAAGVSVKTALLLPALAAAALLVPWTCPGHGPARARRDDLRRGAAVVAGALVVPTVLAVAFAAAGAWDAMGSCLVTHHLAAPAWAPPWIRVPCFVATTLLLVGLLRVASRRLHVAGDPVRRAVLLGGALIHCAAVGGLVGLPRLQSFLPAGPAIALGVAALATTAARAVGARRSRPTPADARGSGREVALLAGAVLAMVALRMALPIGRPTPGLARAQTAVFEDVLALTDPADPVLDPKGASIFRHRPTRLVLEQITRTLLRSGRLRDDIAERMVATRTCVVVGQPGSYPTNARAWIGRFTIPVGRLRVVGAALAANGASADRAFEIAVPARYAIVAERGTAAGTLDGRPYDGPRFLDAGTHTYRPEAAAGRAAVVWAQAIERGFSPFAQEGPP